MKKIISIILITFILISNISFTSQATESTKYVDMFIPNDLMFIHDRGEYKPYVPANMTEEEFITIVTENTPENYDRFHKAIYDNRQSNVDSDYPYERNYFKCNICNKEYNTYEDAVKNDMCGRYTLTEEAYNILNSKFSLMKSDPYNLDTHPDDFQNYNLWTRPRKTYFYDDCSFQNIIENDPEFYHGIHTFLSEYDLYYTTYQAECQDHIKDTVKECEFSSIHQGYMELSPEWTNINYTGKPFYGLQVQPINNYNDGLLHRQDANYDIYYYPEKISDFYTTTPNYNKELPSIYGNSTLPTIPTNEPTVTPTPTVIPTTTPTIEPTTKPSATTKPSTSTKPTVSPVVKPTTSNIKKGAIYTKNSNVYKVTKVTVKNNKIVGGNVTYVTNNNNSVKSVSIPSSIKIKGINFKVTSISSNAFKSCKKLKSVKIGKNVTKIGTKTFSNCKKLKTVTIKSNKIKNVNKKSFNTSTKIKVPKKYYSSYVKLFKKVNISKSRIVKY
jgi:hypothetical protein